MGNVTKNSNIAHIPTTTDNFFLYWLQFIKPLHKLSSKECELLASFLRIRFEYSKSIQDEKLLDKVVLSTETKRQVRDEHGLTPSYFQVVMSRFRKFGIIKDNQIQKKYIPNIEIDSKEYKLILLFDFNVQKEGA